MFLSTQAGSLSEGVRFTLKFREMESGNLKQKLSVVLPVSLKKHKTMDIKGGNGL